MAEWSERNQQPDTEPAPAGPAPWLQVLLGVLCAVAFVALLLGLVYLKAHAG
ncbi:MAG: hypothetical protein QJR03_11370 [Sphaerobacter sp.]|nr:hypothetical protein [Sphaerobacter sp.]